MELGIAAVLGFLIVGITRYKNALTWPAAWTADVMLLLIVYAGSLFEGLALIGMYVSVLVVDLIFGKKMEKATEGVLEKGGTRGMKQVLVNGGPGCLCMVLYLIFKNDLFLLAYYASIFEVMADSIASDVGVLSKKAPRDICTWKVVSKGMSGGVSVLGLVSSGVCCTVAAVLVGVFRQYPAWSLLVIALAPYMGMLLDSVLGSLMQVKYICRVCGMQTEQLEHCGQPTKVLKGIPKISNSMVNLICASLAAVLAMAAEALL